MPVHVSDERAKKAAEDLIKSRKIYMIKDLEDLSEALEHSIAYLEEATKICIRPTHILRGEGVADLVDMSEKLGNYLRSANAIIQDIRTGKAKV